MKGRLGFGIPLVAGRDFSASDDLDSRNVAIVNRAFVDRFWPGAGEYPIGKTFSRRLDGSLVTEVVGVVGDSRYRTLGEDPQPFVYQALGQNMEGTATLVVKAPGGSRSRVTRPGGAPGDPDRARRRRCG